MNRDKEEIKIETEENSVEEKTVSDTDLPIKAPEKKSSWKGFIVFCAVLVAIFITSIILNTVVFMRIEVDGPSMQDTLYTGDFIVANRLKKATYGDVVIISGEKGNDLLVKRVIAMGNDTLKISDGKVYLKKAGEDEFIELEEPYLKEQGKTFWVDNDATERIYEIPEGEVFYMGDNRENSTDSRAAKYETCTEEQIVAVVEDWAISIKGLTGFFGRLFAKKSG